MSHMNTKTWWWGPTQTWSLTRAHPHNDPQRKNTSQECAYTMTHTYTMPWWWCPTQKNRPTMMNHTYTKPHRSAHGVHDDALVPEAHNEVSSPVPKGHQAHIYVAMTNKNPMMKSPARRLQGIDIQSQSLSISWGYVTPQHIHTSLTNRLLV